MRPLRDLPIRWKLTLLLLLVVTVVLLLTSGATMVNDVRTTKSLMVGQFSTLANVLAANSAEALSFDPALTQQVLSDLRVEPTIAFACTYDAQGKVAGRYQAEGYETFEPPPPPEEDGHRFTDDGHLEVFKHVVLGEQPVGTVYLRATTKDLNTQLLRSAGIVVGCLAAALCIALLLSFQLQRVISGPILELAQATQRVTREADFSIRVEKQGNDELGVLCDGFNSMLAQIQQRDAALENANSQLDKTFETVRDAVSQVAATSTQAAARAKEVGESARRTVEVGAAGRRAVDDSIAAMRTVKERFETAAQNILSLAERAHAIGDIITMINEIADETNLLALNAAIEASRAGEHGKGFSVVADEVKALAEQSKKAAAQVRQILSEIQTQTNTAVLSTEQGNEAVAVASKVAAQAGSTIKTLADTLAAAAKATAEIAVSSDQQATGMARVNMAVQDIDEVKRQNLALNRPVNDLVPAEQAAMK